VAGPITTGALVTRVWEKIAGAGDAGQPVSLALASLSKTNMEVVAYSGTDPTSPVKSVVLTGDSSTRTTHTAPAASVSLGGSWAVDYWADKSSTTTLWTPPSGPVVRGVRSFPSAVESIVMAFGSLHAVIQAVAVVSGRGSCQTK